MLSLAVTVVDALVTAYKQRYRFLLGEVAEFNLNTLREIILADVTEHYTSHTEHFIHISLKDVVDVMGVVPQVIESPAFREAMEYGLAAHFLYNAAHENMQRKDHTVRAANDPYHPLQ